MVRHRVNIGYLGLFSLLIFGFSVCLIDDLWMKITIGVVDILAFLFDLGGKAENEDKNEYVDGKLILFQGEDEQHIALGLTMETDPNVLITKKTTTLEVINNIGGSNNGGNKV